MDIKAIRPDVKYIGQVNLSRERLPRFFVYGWKRFDQYLYIGQTSSGAYRFHWPHRIINNREVLKPTDIIEIWFCKDYDDLDFLEKNLIKLYRPLYNKEFLIDDFETEFREKPKRNRIVKEKQKKELYIPYDLLSNCKNMKELAELRKRARRGEFSK